MTVLCFGDSNTWGFDPATGERFPRDVRWPGVLQRELGDGYLVIEEGLNGRTTVHDDPGTPGRNGKVYLVPCLQTHRPLDAVVLALGVNDLKKWCAVSAEQIAESVRELIGIIANSAAGRDGGAPKTLVVAPPPLGRLTGYAEMFEGGHAKSQVLAGEMRRVAEECGCGFLDAADFVICSELDGVHFAATEHDALGRAVAEATRLLVTQRS